MISERARHGIHQIVSNAMRIRLARESSDLCVIEQQAAAATAALDEKRMAVLTISSIAFRLMLILHLDDKPATLAYFMNDVNDKPYDEVFLEIANLCCGAINRDLLRYFPDLGMSTPYVLSTRCTQFLTELTPQLLTCFSITINDSVQLSATVCVCATAPIDFAFDPTETDDNTGELELF